MRKSIKFLINTLLFTSFLGTMSIPLTSCSSNSSNVNSSTITNADKIDSAFTSVRKYIMNNYKDVHTTIYSGISYGTTYSYKITSINYGNYPVDIYAYAVDDVSNEFYIKVNANMSNHYLSATLNFYSEDLKEKKDLNWQTIHVLMSSPNTLIVPNNDVSNYIALGTYHVPLDFSSSSIILFKSYYPYNGLTVDQSTVEANCTKLIDLALKYTSAFLRNVGGNIKDLGFINY